MYTHAKKKRDDFEMETFSLTPNISVKSLSNLTTKGSFRTLRTSWFQNCHCPDLIKNWQRYWGLKRRLPCQNHLFLGRGCNILFNFSFSTKYLIFSTNVQSLLEIWQYWVLDGTIKRMHVEHWSSIRKER